MSRQEFLKNNAVVNACMLALLLIWRAGKDQCSFCFIGYYVDVDGTKYSRYKKHALVKVIFTSISVIRDHLPGYFIYPEHSITSLK